MHPSESLNKLDRRRERPTLQRRQMQRRQRKVRTLYWEQNRHHIHRIMRDRRRNHHSPERRALSLRIKHRRQNHQVQKISHVRKLHEIIQPRIRKSRQPSRRMHAAKVVIEHNQPAVEPPRKNRMHQPLQLLKKENVKRQRIPMPRELQNPIPRKRSRPRQPHNSHRDRTVHRKITSSMRNVSMKYRKQPKHPTQITKRHPLKRPATAPSLRQPASHGAPLQPTRRGTKRFRGGSQCAAVHFHRAALDAQLPRCHIQKPLHGILFQTHVCHPRFRATRANRRAGFTAIACPTASSIRRSPALSPYA